MGALKECIGAHDGRAPDTSGSRRCPSALWPWAGMTGASGQRRAKSPPMRLLASYTQVNTDGNTSRLGNVEGARRLRFAALIEAKALRQTGRLVGELIAVPTPGIANQQIPDRMPVPGMRSDPRPCRSDLVLVSGFGDSSRTWQDRHRPVGRPTRRRRCRPRRIPSPGVPAGDGVRRSMPLPLGASVEVAKRDVRLRSP